MSQARLSLTIAQLRQESLHSMKVLCHPNTGDSSSSTDTSCLVGLQGELRYTYENGSSIQTTIVHPTWHSTPLIGFIENELTKRSIYVGAPQRVSDAVVKQVLSGRGNQIFVPESQYVMSFARSYPSWVQETLRGLGQMKHKAAKSIKQ